MLKPIQIHQMNYIENNLKTTNSLILKSIENFKPIKSPIQISLI